MAYKVLVAEDDNYLAAAYKAMLTKEGFELQIATDGVEALEMLTKFVPDVIVLDLVMPRKDGFAALEEIKQNPSLKDIPVIVASNLGQQDDIQKAKDLGATEFVTKSNLSMHDLVDKIKHLVGAK